MKSSPKARRARAQRMKLRRKLADALAERVGPWCFVCGSRFEVQLGHIYHGVARRMLDVSENVILMCRRCHVSHHDPPLMRSAVTVPGLAEPMLTYWPEVTTGNLLWCKRERDPAFWNPAYFEGLERREYEITRPSEIYLDLYESRVG